MVQQQPLFLHIPHTGGCEKRRHELQYHGCPTWFQATLNHLRSRSRSRPPPSLPTVILRSQSLSVKPSKRCPSMDAYDAISVYVLFLALPFDSPCHTPLLLSFVLFQLRSFTMRKHPSMNTVTGQCFYCSPHSIPRYSTACTLFVSTCALPWALGHLCRAGIHLALPAFQIKGLRIPSPLHSLFVATISHLLTIYVPCVSSITCEVNPRASFYTRFQPFSTPLRTNPLFCACQDSLLRQVVSGSLGNVCH